MKKTRGDSLTPKQRSFVENYVTSRNAAWAARKAGYSAKSARSIGYELLTKPDIRKLVKDQLEVLASSFSISRNRILLEMSLLAFSDVKSNTKFRALCQLGAWLGMNESQSDSENDQIDEGVHSRVMAALERIRKRREGSETTDPRVVSTGEP